MKGPSDRGLPDLSTAPARSSQRPTHGLIRAFRLVVVEGPDTGASLVARGARIVIGTHDTADLKLADRAVSRFHCEVLVEEDELLVRDLESRNGTELDGVSVLAARVRSGAVLRLGDTRVRCDIGIDRIKVRLSERDHFGSLRGGSVRMRELFAMCEAAASSEATILIEGETGTGKEALAESIHRESRRSGGPFAVIDCGAIPAGLLESSLFGHVRGAFTGAVDSRTGVFEEASGGTVFLDEIGELAPHLQPALLRVLERREVKRVGAGEWTPVDVRVVAATNRDVMSEVNAGRFRSDLYFRLAVVRLRLPPLRERRDDLPLLVPALLDSLGVREQLDLSQLLTDEFMAELARHSWPGNVRELRNYLERCVALQAFDPPAAGSPGDASGALDPAELLDLRRPLKEARDRWNRALEQRYVEAIVAAHGGNLSAAARAAGIDRAYLYRLLWRHGMR